MQNAPHSKLLEMTRDFVERVVNKGEFVEVMVDYFDDHEYVQLEGDGRTIEGKQAIIDFETEALKQVKEYHGGTIGAIGVASDDGNGNGVTMAEYSFKSEDFEGKVTEIQEVQVATWKNNKITRNRYYYNPNG